MLFDESFAPPQFPVDLIVDAHQNQKEVCGDKTRTSRFMKTGRPDWNTSLLPLSPGVPTDVFFTSIHTKGPRSSEPSQNTVSNGISAQALGSNEMEQHFLIQQEEQQGANNWHWRRKKNLVTIEYWQNFAIARLTTMEVENWVIYDELDLSKSSSGSVSYQ